MNQNENDIIELAMAHQRALAAAVKTGCEITERRYGRGIAGLRKAYEQACLDPNAKIPSPLTACIAALIALHQEDQTNLYSLPVKQVAAQDQAA